MERETITRLRDLAQPSKDAPPPIRFFVGTSPNHEDAESQAALEWSIRKHSSLPVEIVWMHLSKDPASPFHGWDTQRWATPFSGFRWAVPELCGFEGHAIYCDSDFLFLADPAELWAQAGELAPGKVALGKGGNEWRMCCCLWDCARAKGHVPSLERMRADSTTHGRLNQHFRAMGLVQTFRGDWNSLDRDNVPLAEVKALHYTVMATQPHIPRARARLAAQGREHWYDGLTSTHPRPEVQETFDALLEEAEANGFGVDRYCQHEPYGKIHKRSFKGRAAF